MQDTTNKQKGARALFTGKEAKSTNYGRFYDFEIIKKSFIGNREFIELSNGLPPISGGPA